MASRVGKSKPNKELAAIKERLSDLAADVLEGRKDRANAAVAGQLLDPHNRAVAVELKVREQEDVIERLQEQERLLESRGEGGRRWG